MPHVTFIHGLANKPPADDLLRIWRRALDEAVDPVPLSALGVTSSLVYWADFLYEAPERDVAAYEGTLENTAQAVDGSGDAEIPEGRTPDERAFIEGLRAHLTALSDAEIEAAATPDVAAQPRGALERVPLPWFLKKRIMKAYLRDLHHYLFDVEYAPAGRTPLRIQRSIRKRFVDAMCSSDVSRPHVVVSHSMGTIIAYDCLKRVQECAPIDGFITLGCPLGLDEVQDRLRPEWSRADGYPHPKVASEWVNFFDRLDPVCGFDAELANDFRKASQSQITDVAVQNEGKWRHSATKYLRQPAFCKTLRTMLEG